MFSTQAVARESGRTTRQVDEAIQVIFAGNTYTCMCHSGTPQGNRYLYDAVIRRMKSEHPQKAIKTDHITFTISLK